VISVDAKKKELVGNFAILRAVTIADLQMLKALKYEGFSGFHFPHL
jgi:hypothetical protein